MLWRYGLARDSVGYREYSYSQCGIGDRSGRYTAFCDMVFSSKEIRHEPPRGLKTGNTKVFASDSSNDTHLLLHNVGLSSDRIPADAQVRHLNVVNASDRGGWGSRVAAISAFAKT